MASTVCEELVRQTYHMNICSPRFESRKFQPLAKPEQTINAASNPLELSKLPTNPLSLKGVARFKHYENMLDIMVALKRGGNPVIQSKSISKFRALHEVMEILFFENIIEDLLIDSEFYSYHIDLRSEEPILLSIMAYDFQKYKFCFRPPKFTEGISDAMIHIAFALWKHRVKLNATWSRMRVTAGAKYSIQLLPPKSKELLFNILTTPLYCRVSSIPTINDTTWCSLTERLNRLGINFVSSVNEFGSQFAATFLSEGGVIALSPKCRQLVYDLIVHQGPLQMLIPQDIGSLVCISKLNRLLKEACQGEKKDIIITHCDKEGAIIGHIASLVDNEVSKVFVFEAPPIKAGILEENFEKMEIENIQLIPAQFKQANPANDAYKDVGTIFCNPPSSLTTVNQPIDYIMQNGDEHIYQLMKNKKPSNLSTLEREQFDTLFCALKFKQAQHIAYFTRSILERENQELVGKVLKEHEDYLEKNDPTWSGFELESDPQCNNQDSNGYLCSFKPAPPKVGLTASEVITKALQLGILTSEGMDSEYLQEPTAGMKPKIKKSKKIFSHHDGIPLTFSAKQKMVHSPSKKDVHIESSSSSSRILMKHPKPFL